MAVRIKGLCWLNMLWLLLSQAVWAGSPDFVPPAERTAAIVLALRSDPPVSGPGGDEQRHPALNLQIRDCSGYPYSDRADAQQSVSLLLEDLGRGLETGLQCLIGNGPMGRLHPYHEYQAHRLLSLFESTRTKTFQCVQDAMFATAVATSPDGASADDPLYRQLSKVSHPAVILDTYRLGGVLSQRHDDDTYRHFFHLDEEQILEHRNGQPLRPANLHRYGNRAGLIFHEVVHWLGHEHSALYPDLAHLYETCCFGGSDYISDPVRNREHQQTACGILKDDALWSHGYNRYRQMRLWHFKGYDGLKPLMRADYEH